MRNEYCIDGQCTNMCVNNFYWWRTIVHTTWTLRIRWNFFRNHQQIEHRAYSRSQLSATNAVAILKIKYKMFLWVLFFFLLLAISFSYISIYITYTPISSLSIVLYMQLNDWSVLAEFCSRATETKTWCLLGVLVLPDSPPVRYRFPSTWFVRRSNNKTLLVAGDLIKPIYFGEMKIIHFIFLFQTLQIFKRYSSVVKKVIKKSPNSLNYKYISLSFHASRSIWASFSLLISSMLMLSSDSSSMTSGGCVILGAIKSVIRGGGCHTTKAFDGFS